MDSIPLDLFGGAIQRDNSTGTHTTMGAFGSTVVADNDVTLFARNMQPGSFGFFLNSLNTTVILQPGSGFVLLGALVGRFRGPGQVQQADAAGRFYLPVDLTQWPTPLGTSSVTAGQTWHFQAWSRDVVLGAPTSRFSDRLTVVFD